MMTYENNVVALKIGLDTLCGKRLFYQENSMFILTKITISLYDAIQELCQEDEALLGDKMSIKSGISSCSGLLYTKTCRTETNTTLSFECGATGQN